MISAWWLVLAFVAGWVVATLLYLTLLKKSSDKDFKSWSDYWEYSKVQIALNVMRELKVEGELWEKMAGELKEKLLQLETRRKKHD